jgi:hypothetical protein
MTPIIQYAASDGIWKNYPCAVPEGTNFKRVYLSLEQIIDERPKFLFRVLWPERKEAR